MTDETPRNDAGEEALPVLVPDQPDTNLSGGPSKWFPGGSGFSSVRDLILFGFGVGVLIQQIYFASELNSLIIALGAGAAGLPVVLRTDSKSR